MTSLSGNNAGGEDLTCKSPTSASNLSVEMVKKLQSSNEGGIPDSPLQSLKMEDIFDEKINLRRKSSFTFLEGAAEEESATMDVLHKFRIAMRNVGAHAEGAYGFVEALRAHFTGQIEKRTKHEHIGTKEGSLKTHGAKRSMVFTDALRRSSTNLKKKQSKVIVLHESELSERIRYVLEDTDLSHIDIGEIFEAIDQDGSGTVEWEEFLSFLSLSPSSLNRVAMRLQESLRKASKDASSWDNFYQSLTQEDTMLEQGRGHALIADFTEKDLERYMTKKLNAVRLTPGELHWLYTQVAGENSNRVGELELRMFIRNYKPAVDSSENRPIVDITVSTTQSEAADLEILHYHRIPVNINGGYDILSGKPSKSKRSEQVFLWYRKATIDDFVDRAALQRARVTDIMVNSHSRDPLLTRRGFQCVEPSITIGSKGRHNQYIWIRRNPSDPHPVLDIAATLGDASDIRDNVHFPPYAGFKLTEPMHNINPRGTKKSKLHHDVFLWYRKASFDHEILGVVDIRDTSLLKSNKVGNEDDLSARLARPPSMWNLEKFRHVFISLDQLKEVRIKDQGEGESKVALTNEPTSSHQTFLENLWVHTHRWNHGLESVYDHTNQEWAAPVIPTVSLHGLYVLMNNIDESHIMLDIDGKTFHQVMTNIVTEALDRKLVSSGMRDDFLHILREKSGNRVNRASNLIFHPLDQDPEEDAVHIMVGEVDFLKHQDVNNNINISKLVLFVRSTLPIDISADETNVRFFVIILGDSSAQARTVDTQIGVSLASLLQDEKVVGAAYKAQAASTFIDALRSRLRDIHMVPELHRPTRRGMDKRTRRLDILLGRLGEHHAWRTNQHDRWLERQGDTLSKGFNLHNMWAFLQKFALPLLLGITIALIWSNIDYSSYDKYCGPSHHSSGHGLSSGNETNSTHRHRSMLGTSVSGTHTQLVDVASIKPSFLGLSFNGHDVTLNFIVNDVLMALFFGLAVKEITEALMQDGSLHPVSKAITPLIGTFGGVMGPIVMYVIVIAIQDSLGVLTNGATFQNVVIGWGIPTATDISLAWVTALICFGRGHPAIQHLLLLAIVDDAIGLVIIAIAYTDTSNGPPFFGYLPLVPLGMLIAYAMRKMEVMRWELYIAFAGPFTWFGLILSSLHPALALAFIVPFMPSQTVKERERQKAEENRHAKNRQKVEDLKKDLEHGVSLKEPDRSVSSSMLESDDESDAESDDDTEKHHVHAPLHQFEHDLKWFVDCVVLFLFGLANAGVQLNGIGQLTISIVVALMVGKCLGIGLCTLFAVQVLGIELPRGMGMREIWFLGFIASIGLTVSLFVAGEAFKSDIRLQKEAKMGALLSVVSGVIAIACANICPSIFTTPDFEGEDDEMEEEEEEEELEFDLEDMDSDGDDESLDDVIVKSMLKTLKQMKKSVKKVEARSGMKRKRLIKRYQHARKRIMAHRMQQRKTFQGLQSETRIIGQPNRRRISIDNSIKRTSSMSKSETKRRKKGNKKSSRSKSVSGGLFIGNPALK